MSIILVGMKDYSSVYYYCLSKSELITTDPDLIMVLYFILSLSILLLLVGIIFLSSVDYFSPYRFQ